MMTNIAILQAIPVALRGLNPVAPPGLQETRHLKATLDWIERAFSRAGDGGISKGYDLLRNEWAPSYPETTGYTIPTLFNAATVLDQPALWKLALTLADYLLESATPEGGVVHWKFKQTPIVFDTGQVMFGWLAAFETTGDERYLLAATRAGDWLGLIQHSSGSWKSNQHLGVEKVIDTRVAWALLRLFQHTGRDRHRQTAINNLEWALKQQEVDGWYKHCAFLEGDDPFTHTLAYTAEGFFECGQLLGNERYVDISKVTADALLARQRDDGSLASTYGAGWRETSRSSCLTGNCQMARLWLQFYERSADQAYYTAAIDAITFVARTQNLRTSNLNIWGAVAGSYPIYGVYERFKYPNWAAKFFIDALLTLEALKNPDTPSFYVG